MVTVNLKKQWNGNIDISENTVKKAIADNDSILVTCAEFPGEIAIYYPEELKNPLKKGGPFTSKFGKKEEYYLYMYKWKRKIPDNETIGKIADNLILGKEYIPIENKENYLGQITEALFRIAEALESK